MMHKVVVEVEMAIEEADQGYAASEAERRLLSVRDVKRVIVKKSLKQSTGDEDSNYGTTRIELVPAEVKRQDPGISMSVVGEK